MTREVSHQKVSDLEQQEKNLVVMVSALNFTTKVSQINDLIHKEVLEFLHRKKV